MKNIILTILALFIIPCISKSQTDLYENKPLYVLKLNGNQYSTKSLFYGVQDVETISILKDKKAISIYGEGAIDITFKKEVIILNLEQVLEKYKIPKIKKSNVYVDNKPLKNSEEFLITNSELKNAKYKNHEDGIRIDITTFLSLENLRAK